MTTFGLSMGVSSREPLRRVGTLAAGAEERGFDALWLIDSHLVMGDVYASLAVAALSTSKMRLGTGVTNPLTRHVTVTANAIASIDDLSDGRAILGVGSGDSAVQPLGLRGSRVAELERYVVDSRSLLAGEKVGEPPVKIARRRPDVPVFVAATQPRMLQLAGRVADGIVLLGFADPEVIDWQLGHVERGLAEAGRSWADLFVDYWATISVRDDAVQATDDVRSWCAGQARWLSRWKEVPPRLEPFRAEAVRAAEEYDFSEHLSLRARHVTTASDDFVRLAAIAGTKDECLGRLRDIAADDRIARITLTLLSGGREDRLEALGDLVQEV
jgi:5,10-methylenetetrahydromethanopterin reductase